MSAIWVRSEALDIDVDAVGTVNTDIKLVEGSNKIVITVTAPNILQKQVIEHGITLRRFM